MKKWKCPNDCNPEVDAPFFYPAPRILREIDYEDELGVLAYPDLSPSNTYVDGTRGVPDEIQEAIKLMDRLPLCVECGKEVVEEVVLDIPIKRY